MNNKIIEPFIKSTVNVLTTMAQTNPTPGTPYNKSKDVENTGVVTGIIGMAGNEINGFLIISFDEGSILEIVSNMLMEKFDRLNDDVLDAVGEITNMIAGGTKKELSELGYQFEMATPMTMKGDNVELRQYSNGHAFCVPFETPAGKFVIETTLAPRETCE